MVMVMVMVIVVVMVMVSYRIAILVDSSQVAEIPPCTVPYRA